MKRRSQAGFFATTSIAALLVAGAVQAQAQDQEQLAQANEQLAQAQQAQAADPDLETIVVTGVRGAARTVESSPVPIDVFRSEDLRSVPSSDTLDILKAVVPSFAVNRNVNSNTGTFVRPIRLRGLSEDKTLLLVNSKRRHKSASVGTAGSGSQGADAAVIPAIAIKSVEVLRDGAAAQYGSDAIAGVINFILKDASEGIEFSAQTGQYYKGDGFQLLLSSDVGLPIGTNGFINVAGQFNSDNRTSRGKQFTSAPFDAIAYAAANPLYASLVDLSNPIQRQGAPDSEAKRFFVNSGYTTNGGVQFYAFANYSDSKAIADANYRYPGGGQPVLDTPIRLETGRVFRFNEMFPAGYRPSFGGFVTDYSFAGGVKGDFAFGGGDATYDFSARYGHDRIVYKVYDSMNASYGPAQALTKRDFTSLDFRADEYSFNGDFSWSKEIGLHGPLGLSAGLEYRDEGYTIISTEKASYEAGIFANQDPFDFCTNETTVTARTLRPTAPQNQGIQCNVATDPVYRVMPAGANVFNGIPPELAGEFRADSKSGYIEAAVDITDRWFVDVAGRYEDFSIFGDTLNGKFATRFEVADGFGLRGSVGTGFRAPTPGMLNTTAVSISSVDGVSLLAGIFPTEHPVSKFLGANPLKPENSVNYSLGFTANPAPGFTVTIDGYIIDITDQIWSTSNIPGTPAIQAQLVAAGVVAGNSISNVRFFQNAFNSRTSGFDVVATYGFNWDNGQRTSLVGSFNMNKYKIKDVKIAGLFNAQSIFNFENNEPKWRSIFTATQEIGDIQLMARANVFGPYTRQNTTTPFATQRHGTLAQFDLEAKYNYGEHYTFTVGAKNIGDKYPAPNLISAGNGSIYADGVVDFQGGFYFARIDVKY